MNPTLCLLGRDYPQLGPLASVGLPGGGGLALSRGAHPKPYAHQDPNEDGALVVVVGEVRLLAVADGHSGVAASEAALAGVCERAAELAGASGAAFRSAVAGLAADVERQVGNTHSRTCLVLLRCTPELCEFASIGDASVFRGSTLAPLTRDNRLLLGGEVDLAAASVTDWYGELEPGAGERIAAVSDGITNFIPDPAQIRDALSGPLDDVAAARAIAAAALAGGAGDNVAVALFAPRPRV